MHCNSGIVQVYRLSELMFLVYSSIFSIPLALLFRFTRDCCFGLFGLLFQLVVLCLLGDALRVAVGYYSSFDV